MIKECVDKDFRSRDFISQITNVLVGSVTSTKREGSWSQLQSLLEYQQHDFQQGRTTASRLRSPDLRAET